MPLIVITPLAVEPVEIDEIKEQCRVELDQTAQDAMLLRLAKAAREWLEEVTGRSFGEQTFEWVLDRFPGGALNRSRDAFGSEEWVHPSGRLVGPHIKLPRSPLIEVESVKYLDDTGTLTTLAAADYVIDSDSVPARLAPAPDTAWPVTQFRVNAVRVRFRAGYAPNDSPSTDDLPEALKHALLLQTQAHYDGIDLSMTIDALIRPYRIWEF